MPRVQDVFTPNESPTVTYVDRSSMRLEEKLRDALSIKNMAVSLSGPSKSGKTVLTQRVIDPDLLIKVSGADIKKPDDLWNNVLAWMGTPEKVSTSHTTSGDLSLGVSGSAESGLSLISKGKFGGSAHGKLSHATSKISEERKSSFQEVVREIGGSDFIVFIDDFHYIDREIQNRIGREIKSICEQGVKICAASVPHRADDVVRSNPELSGRVASIDINYWTPEELEKIATQGFEAMNVALPKDALDKLCGEAFGVPQLMQSLCLSLCLELNIRETRETNEKIDAGAEDMTNALERTSDFANYSSVVAGLHSGPKERGTERKQFDFVDGSTGDVYRAILLALKQDPPRLSFKYDVLMDRVKAVCIDDSPSGSSITQALAQMQKLSEVLSPNVPILEWDETVLDVAEPYFLFYLRGSKKLGKLA